jgi:hypothetical protein
LIMVCLEGGCQLTFLFWNRNPETLSIPKG